MVRYKEKIGILKRFFSPVKSEPILFIKPFLVSCLWVIFPLITVEIFKRATTFIQNGEYEGVKQYVFIYVGVSIVRVLMGFILKNVDLVSVNKIEQKIQGEWFNKYFKLDNTDVEKLGTGKMQSIMSKGIATWKSLFHKITSSIPAIVITWIFALIQIYQALGLWYCMGFLILPFFVIFFIHYFNGYAIPWRKKRSNILTDYGRHFVKILMSKMEIVQNGKEKAEITKANNILDEATEAKKKVCLYLLAIGESVRIFGHALNIFILGYGIYLVNVGGDLSIFVGLIVCSTLFTGAMEKFSSFYKEFTNEFTDVEKMWDTFDNMSIMKNMKSKNVFKYTKGNIDIENISFGYGENKSVFDNFSLKISGGKKVALVGESGSGKSTLIKLIAGYLVPDSGNIYVDGQDISEINVYDYFSKLGFLTQDPSVFDGTIYENLIYALKEKPSDVLLKKIIKAAKCEFIYDFAEGLQTEIGERGIRLSGGQKQRLAIAKIMLKNPNIILLDEPTSALDSFNEEEISQALNNLFKGKTVIIVAHRLQTVKSADRILLFENGKVVEDGTHQSLIKKKGKYKRMLDLQTGF